MREEKGVYKSSGEYTRARVSRLVVGRHPHALGRWAYFVDAASFPGLVSFSKRLALGSFPTRSAAIEAARQDGWL